MIASAADCDAASASFTDFAPDNAAAISCATAMPTSGNSGIAANWTPTYGFKLVAAGAADSIAAISAAAKPATAWNSGNAYVDAR